MKWLNSEEEFIKNFYEKFGLQYCSEKLNKTKSAVQRKAVRLKIKYKKNYFYMSEEFKEIVKNSFTLSEICNKMNMSVSYGNRKTIKKYIKINNLDISHFYIIKHKVTGKKIDLIDILIEDSTYSSTTNLKEKLYNEGIKKRECELCGQDENWKGRKISLILDHINGINDDNRLENLQIVCPNCNAALDTFSGKNIKIKNNNYFVRENNYDLIRNNKNEVNKKIKICECGKQIHNSSNKCIECNNISQRRVKNRPSKEELILMVKESSLESVGRKYGVTGNSVKKWLKK